MSSIVKVKDESWVLQRVGEPACELPPVQHTSDCTSDEALLRMFGCTFSNMRRRLYRSGDLDRDSEWYTTQSRTPYTMALSVLVVSELAIFSSISCIV